ncbi:hypothetical protein, partial [Hymenobacter terrestris]
SDIRTFAPIGPFCTEVAFDIAHKEEAGVITYWFLLADAEGLANYARHNLLPGELYYALKKVILVKEYSYDMLREFLLREVENKCAQHDNNTILQYLETEFNVLED